MSEIASGDIAEAADRIARSPDGQLLYRHLQKIVMTVSRPETSDCALRQLEGRRMFASELMGMMSKGIAESDRYAIAFVRSSEQRPSHSRGAGRRVTADSRVAGWNDTDTGNTGTAAGSSGPDAA